MVGLQGETNNALAVVEENISTAVSTKSIVMPVYHWKHEFDLGIDQPISIRVKKQCLLK
ncbi:hypothetical protein D3C72_2493710 [compost metagenome]